MPIDAIETKFKRRARDEVRSFSRLKLDGVDVGLNMLQDLEKHPDGIETVLGDNIYPSCCILRGSDTFSLPKCKGKPLKRFRVSRETQQEGKHTHYRQRALKRKVRASWCFP